MVRIMVAFRGVVLLTAMLLVVVVATAVAASASAISPVPMAVLP